MKIRYNRGAEKMATYREAAEQLVDIYDFLTAQSMALFIERNECIN